jgi:hypothetical protein
MALAESNDAPGLALHGLALLFLAGRAFYILWRARGDKENFKLRVRGMQLTFASVGLVSLLALILAFAPGFDLLRNATLRSRSPLKTIILRLNACGLRGAVPIYRASATRMDRADPDPNSGCQT